MKPCESPSAGKESIDATRAPGLADLRLVHLNDVPVITDVVFGRAQYLALMSARE